MTQDHAPAIADRLADKIHAFTLEQVTPKALAVARRAITDTIGVTFAGIPEPCTQALLAVPGVATSPGSSLILGTDRRTSALDAALVNGTAAHALDYDDFCAVLGGHQSVPLVPALFAVAEERRFSGLRLLAAYIVGVETELRIARGVNFHHYDKGWHPTATLGVFGAVAAVSHLIGLAPGRIACALGLAASFACGLKANFGTMTKPLHIGHCGRDGVLAALLAEQGFTANPAAFEHDQGFLNVFNGPGTFDVARIFADWGAPLEIEDPTVALRQFPCCGSTHPAVMMALELYETEGVRAPDVRAVEIRPHVRRFRHTDTPDPQTPLAAKYSVQYVVARALVDGAVRLKDFENDAYAEPEIRRLLGVTTAMPHPDMPEDGAAQWGAEVTVTLNDGRRLARRVDDVIGRGGDNPMSDSEMWVKFEDCARRSLPREQIAPLFERLETLESAADVNQVTKLMQGRAKVAPQPIRFATRTAPEFAETTWSPEA